MTERCRRGKEEMCFGEGVVRGPISWSERRELWWRVMVGRGCEPLSEECWFSHLLHVSVSSSLPFAATFPPRAGRPANPCPARSDYKPQPLFS